ncbi:NAD(P)/FAD-dependent oxidoreductase [Flavobacterium silvaticum]|uniref:NAD(P)/FAD-dependent oxidoreductase n=1 Tax=Flavobacterium silvaticum TaxID=1852020 RepID=A0A972FN94_9FLAO|nr:NAD(P)/FAD-dependent oxidoreductase [Flavobacterium silvaticum]NMH29161.1 NAD(P)/FAD-dependent oxidoreductase [Flavobacterium silvaticum]
MKASHWIIGLFVVSGVISCKKSDQNDPNSAPVPPSEVPATPPPAVDPPAVPEPPKPGTPDPKANRLPHPPLPPHPANLPPPPPPPPLTKKLRPTRPCLHLHDRKLIMNVAPTYDVIIVGGSHAGLSAAMTLGRCLRNVLILDAGSPCNFASEHAHNLLGHDGESPQEILNKSREQVLKYPSVTYQHSKVEVISGTDGEFEVISDQGISFLASKIILATGVSDILPAIKGISECWAKTAIHCPYCHGYEIKGQKIGILSHGQAALDMAMLMKNWSANLTVLSNTNEDIGFDQRRIFRENEIELIETEIEEVAHSNGIINSLSFTDGTSVSFEALYIRPGIKQPGTLALDLGVELDHHGFIITDHAQRTAIKGIFAAGDCCNPSRSIALAIGQGNMAGMCLNHELIVEKPKEELIDRTHS